MPKRISSQNSKFFQTTDDRRSLIKFKGRSGQVGIAHPHQHAQVELPVLQWLSEKIHQVRAKLYSEFCLLFIFLVRILGYKTGA
jgi:hypothetical protein